MLTEKEIINPSPDCLITSKRMIIVQTERVFEAWTIPDQLKVWFGPKGFTIHFTYSN